MFKILERIFCKHDNVIIEEKIESLKDQKAIQTYLVCKKCGKVKKHILKKYKDNDWK